MVAMTVAVRSRRSAVRGVVGRSPHFSAFTIGLSSYGLWGHCGHSECWFPCPGVPPFYYCAVREGTHCHTRQAPPIRARIGLVSQSGDHIPSILPLDLHISSLLNNPLIHKSVHRAHCIMTVSYVLSDTMTMIQLSVSKQILI
jgi:hypothetical protein